MEAAYLIFAIYFALPTLAAKLPQFLPELQPQNGELPYTERSRKAAIFTSYCTLLLVFFGGHSLITKTTSLFVPALSLPVLLATLPITYSQWKKSAIFTEHRWLFSIVLAYATLTISWISTQNAEAIVSEELGIETSSFQTSVLGVALMILPLWWLVALSFSLLIPYFFNLLRAMLLETKSAKWEKAIQRNYSFISLVHAAGLVISALFLTSLIPVVASHPWMLKKIHTRIYVSTFPLTKSPCQIKTNEGDRFRVVSDDEILIARVTKNAAETDDGLPVYSISREKCTRIKESAAL